MMCGNGAFRRVAVDDEFRVDVKAMETLIAADRAAGHRPFCVIGTVGTVQTGATDDLEALADLAQREGLWFHVDGAFGAMARLSSETAAVTRGMERGFYPCEVVVASRHRCTAPTARCAM